jgi:hypothetical protein
MIELNFDCRNTQPSSERHLHNHEATSLCTFALLRVGSVGMSTNAQFSRDCRSTFLKLTGTKSHCSFAKRSSKSKVRDCLEIRCRRSVRRRSTS